MINAPFLVKYARVVPCGDSNSKDIATQAGDESGDGKLRTVGTFITKVDRETTDDQ